MKRLLEKIVIATIILSCGFVMQTDPPEQSRPGKVTDDAGTPRMRQSADAARQDVEAGEASARYTRRARW